MTLLHSSLQVRMSVLVALIAGGSIAALIYLSLWSNKHYYQESTQRVHWDLARYVSDQFAPLFLENGTVDQAKLAQIAIHTMMINPSVEVFLLDTQGVIVGTALPTNTLQLSQLDLTVIKQFLNRERRGALYAQHPRNPSEPSIFSVAEVIEHGQLKGYLYIVLASLQAESIREKLQNSHIVRLSLAGGGALALLLVFVVLWHWYTITTPLRALSQKVGDYRRNHLQRSSSMSLPVNGTRDEVLELSDAFELMQKRIQLQFKQLSELDNQRREFITNISHDLRTPLASMQGYLETLLLKYDELTDSDRRRYLETSHRHSQQLSVMVSQLFELSKLETGRTSPKLELFSFTELLYDICMDYQLRAQQRGVNIEVNSQSQYINVYADIALIQRVMQNLMDNALRYTPEGGTISVELQTDEAQVSVSVQDTGSGISAKDAPYVFDRFYQAEPTMDNHAVLVNSGLGLNIVKRILELHGTTIRVGSNRYQGTQFSFQLPRYATRPATR